MKAELKGFWSYVRRDDSSLDGVITRLSDHVVDEYEFKRGDHSIDLFRDTAKVKWGDKWQQKVREAIRDGAFFIPIVTPRFITSEECRNELLEFAEQEEEEGREGLIMPLYFAEVPAIERKDVSDPVIKILIESQREDWRERRLLDRSVQSYKKAVDKLVNRLIEIADAGPQEAARAPSAESDGDGDGDDDSDPSDDGPREQEPSPKPPGGEGILKGAGVGTPAILSSLEADTAEDEPWALEQLAEGEDALPRMVETLDEIGKVLESVGNLAQASGAELDQVNEEGAGFKGRLAAVNRLANRLAGPAERLQELTSQYTSDLEVVDPAVLRMIELAVVQYEEAPEDTEEFFVSISGMIDSSEEGAEQIAALIKAMESPAQFSRELNKPIASMRGSLQSMLDADEVIGSWREHISDARSQESG
jgi:hypothetical protein